MSESHEDATPSEPASSLLEDASTLLMFHSSAVTKKLDSKEDQQQEKQQTVSEPYPALQKPVIPSYSFQRTTSSSSKQALPKTTPKTDNLASPGPAIAALAESDSDGEKDKNSKAIVAAAALAAAAGIPLTLISREQNTGSNSQKLQDLQKAAKDASPSLKEAIQDAAQNAVPKEHIEALKDKANLIRRISNESSFEQTEPGSRSETDAGNKNNNFTTAHRDSEDHETPIEKVPSALENKQNPSRDLGTPVVVKQEESNGDERSMSNSETVIDHHNNETEEETSVIIEKPKRQRKTKKKEKETKSETYVVDPDAGIISCICGYDHDDGFTIQCDKCNRWQHAICMGIDSIDNAPDDYMCNICQPRKLDVKRAKALQAQRLNSLKKKTEKRSKSSDHEHSTTPSGNASKDSVPISNTKPKPKPRENNNPYNKNLDDSDIPVPDAKDVYKTFYYELNDYDYQDKEIFDLVNSLKAHNESRGLIFTKNEFQSTRLPELKVKPYSEIHNKKFNGILKLGLFTEDLISPGDLVIEFLGEICSKAKYIQDTRNHYRIWGSEKAHVRFIQDLPLVIDARSSGNIARFIRRSCNPNCMLRTILVGDDALKFVITAIKPIKPSTELTLGWNWDINHPIRGILEGKTFDMTNDADKPGLILSVESILTFVECACTQTNECALAKVKKASAHIYRSTRKGGNNGSKLLHTSQKHIPIQERLHDKENFNLQDSVEMLKSKSSNLISDLCNGGDTEEVAIRPYIYGYWNRKRKVDDEPSKVGTYLPIPFEIRPQKTVEMSTLQSNVPAPPKPVKKLSFADYKRKKKPL